jgi:arylsulfatase A-like enzyme
VPKPLRGGKEQLYEGGIRAPFLVRWPAVMKPGTQCLEPVISNDLFPTLVEAASGKIELEEKQATPGRVLIN